jgi:ribosome-associated toxin RatA of RatAB toxin-antitoxin module
MATASRSVTVNVPPEKLFDVIIDYEKYPEFLPEVKKVKVDAGQGAIKEVTYTVDIKAKVITYTLKHTAEKPTKCSWTMIKGEMMKGNDGSWTLKPGAQPNTTDATYTIDLKLSALVPGFIEKVLAEQNLPGLLANFKKRAESLK